MTTHLAVLSCLALFAGPARAGNLETLSWEAAAGYKAAVESPFGVLRPLPQPPIAGMAVPARGGVQPRFSPGGGVDTEILKRLDGVRRSVDIAMYSFSHASLVARVKALAKEGRKVRLVLNDANKNSEASKAFEDAGVDVRYVTPVMHHKFAILDGPQVPGDDPAQARLLTGSGNWSASSARSFDEDFLAFEGEGHLVRAFQAEFNLLWSRSRDIPGPVSHGDTVEIKAADAPVVFTSANMEARRTSSGWTFSPKVSAEGGVAGRSIVAAMDGAKERIRIASAHFRRKDFYAALVRALGRGVRVDMLLDQQEYSGPAAKNPADSEHLDEILGRTGADVRYKTYSRVWKHQTAKQMHAKYMIVDERLALTGSFNWSDNAELQTMDNLLRLEGPEVAAYVGQHSRIFDYGRGGLEPLLGVVRGQKGRGPCDFEPMSISADEMRRLRAAYSWDACR